MICLLGFLTQERGSNNNYLAGSRQALKMMCEVPGTRWEADRRQLWLLGLSHHKADVLSRGRKSSSIVTATSTGWKLSASEVWSFFKPKETPPHHLLLPQATSFCSWVSLSLQRAQEHLPHLALGQYYWMMTSLWWNTPFFNSLTRVPVDDSEGLVVHICLCYAVDIVLT